MPEAEGDATLTREKQDRHFMELALRQAELAATRGQTPFGAVVVCNEKVIGEGHNKVRADLDPTAHAEIVAIRDAWRRAGSWQALRAGMLYSSCEPCLLCSFVITQIGFHRVVFAARGTDVPLYQPLLDADLSGVAAWVNAQPDWTHLEIVGDFMREHALKIINEFPWSQAKSRAKVDPS